MADNVQLNSGAGGVIAAADEISAGVYAQRIKLIHGSDGVNDGDVAAGNPLPVTDKAGTSALSNITASAASQTALSANASRRNAIYTNDADKPCYLKYGTTASATSFTKKLFPGEQWEPAVNYTGRVDVIWDSSPSGALRVTELTA